MKELRTRLRARAAMAIELVYVLALCGIGAVMLVLDLRRPAWETGRSLLNTLLHAQAVLLFFVAPLVTASTVSGEKEHKTFDSLMATPVSPRRVLLAKLASAMAVFAMLLAVALPFAAVAYLLGGVSLDRVALGWGYTLLLTIAAGAMGLYWSTRFERSISAIPAAAVCTVIVAAFGPFLLEDAPPVLRGVNATLFLRAMLGDGMERHAHAIGTGWPLVFGLLLAVTVALFAAAVQRLKFAEERRYGVMRAFALLAWTLLVAGTATHIGGNGPAPSPVEAGARFSMAIVAALVSLGLLAPWIGASLPVIRSARARPGGSRAVGLGRRLLTGPLGYTSLLAIAAGLGLVMLRRTIGPTQAPGAAMALVGASVWVTPAMLAMLAFRLADRRTVRGRFIGLAVAGLLALVLVLGPAITFTSRRFATGTAGRNLQLYSLSSPLTSALLLQARRTDWMRELTPARDVVGDTGLWAVAPAFHALLLGLLLLPVFPSGAAWRAGGGKENRA